MTRLLTEHDGAEMARILRALADDLEEGTRKRGDITRANTWNGNLKGVPTDGGGGRSATGKRTVDGDLDVPPDEGDPTGEAATARTHWTSHIGGDIAKAADRTLQFARATVRLIDRIPAPLADDDDDDAITARLKLADQNLRAGDCDCCGRTCTGDRDDRLTHLVVATTYWTQGEERERRAERDVCAACRMAWKRAEDRGEDFAEWERHRQAHQQREPA